MTIRILTLVTETSAEGGWAFFAGASRWAQAGSFWPGTIVKRASPPAQHPVSLRFCHNSNSGSIQ